MNYKRVFFISFILIANNKNIKSQRKTNGNTKYQEKEVFPCKNKIQIRSKSLIRQIMSVFFYTLQLY